MEDLLKIPALHVGVCSRSLFKVPAQGLCSRSLPKVSAQGPCSRSLLTISYQGPCSMSLTKIPAHCSRSLLKVLAQGTYSSSLLKVSAQDPFTIAVPEESRWLAAILRHCVIRTMISVALLLYPGLRLALSECKQWRELVRFRTLFLL